MIKYNYHKQLTEYSTLIYRELDIHNGWEDMAACVGSLLITSPLHTGNRDRAQTLKAVHNDVLSPRRFF